MTACIALKRRVPRSVLEPRSILGSWSTLELRSILETRFIPALRSILAPILILGLSSILEHIHSDTLLLLPSRGIPGLSSSSVFLTTRADPEAPLQLDLDWLTTS
jgi:hypothetical protein